MLNRIRKIGFIIGLIAFLWFFIPFVVAGICNIGNITGMLVAFLLMLYMKCMPLIHMWIRTMWEKKIGKGLCVFASIIVFIIAALVVVESSFMFGAATKEHKENATAIVLGCRVYGERPSLSLVERLEAAYDYLIENPKAVCVVSGGKGDSENISEAEGT